MRYTYLINPNASGQDIFIEIDGQGSLLQQQSSLNIISIIVFWTLFFLGNIALFLTLFSSITKVKTIVFLYLLLSVISAGLFALDHWVFNSPFLFSLGGILKNFLLSPMFTAMGYIVIEYFHWFIRPS